MYAGGLSPQFGHQLGHPGLVPDAAALGWRRHLAALAVALSAVALTAAVVLLALDRASGVTLRSPGDCCDTEFIDGPTLQLGWLALPLLAVAAYLSVRPAVLGLAGVVLADVLAAAETVDRYADSGWGDGLEVFAFLHPILMAVGGSVAILVGWLVRTSRRRPGPRPAPARTAPPPRRSPAR